MMSRMSAGRLKYVVISILVLCMGLYLYPDPFFRYMHEEGRWTVKSDRPIDDNISAVLRDAERRLTSSDSLDANDRFKVYICNSSWRLFLRTGGTKIGGAADVLFTRTFVLRESDINNNRLIPPAGTLSDEDARPLSYFFAHEAAHILQSRRYGRFVQFSPQWLREGHADLIAKAGDFDPKENYLRFREDDDFLSYERSGLYREFHLMVYYVSKVEGKSFGELYRSPPSADEIKKNMEASQSYFDQL